MTSFHRNVIVPLGDWIETATGIPVSGVYPGRRRANVAYGPADVVIRRGEVESISETGHDDLWVHRYEIEVSVKGSPGFNQAGANLQDTLDGHLQTIAAGIDGTRILSDFIPEIVAVSAGELAADADESDAGRIVGILGVEFLVNGSGSAFPGAPSAATSTLTASPAQVGVSAASTVTVTILDSSSNPVPGQLVVIAATGTGNTIVQPTALTNSSGVATGTVASTEVGTTLTVSATANGAAVAATATVEVGTPLTILGVKLAGWFDASDATSITSDANGVSSWANKGYGTPTPTALAQAADANKPNVVASSLNGLDSILFDGDNAESLAGATPFGIATPWRIFMVRSEVVSITGSSLAIVDDDDEANNHVRLLAFAAGSTQARANDGVDVLLLNVAASANPANATHLVYLQWLAETTPGDDSMGCGIDTMESGSFTSPGVSDTVVPTGIDVFRVGAWNDSLPFHGSACEIVCVDESTGVMTAGELAALASYFTAKWAVILT